MHITQLEWFRIIDTFDPTSLPMKFGLKQKLYLLVFGIILILGLILYFPRAYRGSVTVVVKDKERINYEDDGKTKSKYLIYTDNEVFENVDDWFYFKFSSSDIYGQLNEGDQYKIWVTGWRIQIFSTYRNIIALERVVTEAAEP